MALCFNFRKHFGDEITRRDLVHIGIGASFTFRILKILKSHIFMSPKIIALKYIGKYLEKECMQRSLV
jgi:hypothetical protein